MLSLPGPPPCPHHSTGLTEGLYKQTSVEFLTHLFQSNKISSTSKTMTINILNKVVKGTGRTQ
jgi:hypothetical protein